MGWLVVTFPRPSGEPQFTEPWFLWFFGQLGLPEGHPIRWEGHLLAMTREFFQPELVHLLVLIPKGNWKTTWEAGLAVWHLLTVPAPRVYCGAADKEQAQELYEFAAHFAQSEPELEDRLLVRASTKEIRLREAPHREALKVLASDDSRQGGKKQGKNITLGLIDELHAHENENLYVDIRSGGFKRREADKFAGDRLWWTRGKLATITTAGYDAEATLGKLRSQFLGDSKRGVPPAGTVKRSLRVESDGNVVRDPQGGRLTVARTPSGRSVMLEWAAREDDAPGDFATVKFANPASTVTIESLEDAYESLTPWAYARYRMNRWTLGYEAWVSEAGWDACAEPGLELEKGADTVAFLDMARYRDCAALALMQPRDGRPHALEVQIWESGGERHPIEYEAVKDAIRAAHKRYALRAVGFDPMYFDQAAEELLGEGIAMEKWPQSNERMCPAWADLHSDIQAGAIAHDGNAQLRAHMLAGKAQDVGPNKFRVVKSHKRGPPIDAAVATAGANALSRVALGSMYDDEGITI